MEAMRPQIAGGPVGMRFQLTNRLERPVWVLRWNTPWDGWRGTVFSVSLEGHELPYQGVLAKRGDPTAAEYLKLRTGESMITGLDLSQAYDMSKPGLYTVKAVGYVQDVIRDGASPPRPRDRFKMAQLSCNEVTLDVVKGSADNKINY